MRGSIILYSSNLLHLSHSCSPKIAILRRYRILSDVGVALLVATVSWWFRDFAGERASIPDQAVSVRLLAKTGPPGVNEKHANH